MAVRAHRGRKKCEVCKPGYERVDQSCVSVKAPKCVSGKFAPNQTFTHAQYLFEHLMYHGLQGCNQCEAGMVNLRNYKTDVLDVLDAKFANLNLICMQKEETIATTINNCLATAGGGQRVKKHITDGATVKCVECVANYIIDTTGNCQKKDFLQNCKIAQPENPSSQSSTGDNSTYCDTCETGYFNVAGKCIDELLYAKCQQRDESTFKNYAECLKCKNYYYLERSIKQLNNGNTEIKTDCFPYYQLDENDNFVDFLPNKPISNCIQFDMEEGRLYCVECEANHVLLILQGDERNGEKGFNRYCMNVNTGKQPQCKRFDTFKQSVGVLSCDECEPDYFLEEEMLPPSSDQQHKLVNGCIPIQKTANCETYELDTSIGNNYQAQLYNYNYMPRISSLKCLQCTEDYFLNQGDNICQERVHKNSVNYGGQCEEFQVTLDECKLCKEGYFLSADRLSCKGSPLVDRTTLLGSIQSCKPIEECERHHRLEGLSTPLETVLSCHVCKRTNEIPFVALAAGEGGQTDFRSLRGIRAFKIEKPNSRTIRNSTFCIEPTAANFNMSSEQWEDLPANCGIGAINTDVWESQRDSSHQAGNIGETNPPAFSLHKVATFCAACKPGYRAVQREGPEGQEHIITQCVKIEFCEESHAFNNCTKCVQGYSFRYQEDRVQYDQCVPATNNNECFSWNVETAKCEFCCKGHYLNKDGVCERINPPACKRGEYSPRISFSLVNLNTGLYLNSSGTGCNKCEEGFSGVYLEQISLTCTESPYHIKSLPEVTNYKKNCLNYRWEDEALLCAQCADQFVPDESNGDCISISKIKNCILARDEEFCVKCDDQTVLVNGECKDKSIQNCVLYTYEKDSNTVICEECAPNYYREANQCKLGQVKNCEFFETKTICNVCKEGFQLVQRNDGVSYCYPIDENLNCSQFDSEGFQKGNLKCSQCVTNNFVISTLRSNFYDTHCMKFFEIPNCVKYDIKPVVADSGFFCLQCTDNFYVKDGECEVRELELENCEEYLANDDKCQTCKDGFYLSDDGVACTSYPIGTKHCRNYRKVSGEIQCLGCLENYYLDADQCKAIDSAELIDNCLYHIAPNVCETCNPGFIIVDSECKLVTAQNCVTIENLNSCGSCPDGYGFVETNGVKNCVQQNVANCAKFNPEPTYPCLQCNQNYYPVDGVCVEVPAEKRILNCLINLNENECQRCSEMTALSVDKTRCINSELVSRQIDHNCEWTVVQEENKCNSCRPGYVFDNEGDCVRCQVAQPERCYQCDPLNLKKCILCNPGYFHNVNGGCSHPSESTKVDNDESDMDEEVGSE